MENIRLKILWRPSWRHEHGAKKRRFKSDHFFPQNQSSFRVRSQSGRCAIFNDLKATNVHAVLRALDSFDDNVILIAGGRIRI